MATDLQETVCWQCGAAQQAVTGLYHLEDPQAGDVNVCIECGGICVLEAAAGGLLRARRPTEAEFITLAMSPDVQHAQAMVRAFNAARRAGDA